MGRSGHSHRSTLKKDHKPFKSRHASKGSLKNQYKGKVEKTGPGSGKTQKVVSKLQRKNQSKQLKEHKIQETKLARRLFEGASGAEKVITVIALTPDISPAGIASQLVNSIKASPEDPDVEFSGPSVVSLRLPRFKSNVKFIMPDQNNLISILDATKVSDFVIFGLSAEQEVEKEYGEQILRAIVAQGVASVVGVLPNVISAYPKKNLQQDIRQSLQSFFAHFFPTEEKLYALESDSECLNCIRFIAQKLPKSISWRDSRAYLLADSLTWVADADQGGFAIVEGTVRGVGFNVNRLVHIPGHGDFQVQRIEKVAKHKNVMEDEESHAFNADSNQESLEELNPVEAEMEDFDDDYEYDDYGVKMEGKNYFDGGSNEVKRKWKVPEGTSEYQSKWLLDDVLEAASDVESADEMEEVGEDDEVAEELTENGMDDDDDMKSQFGDNQSEMFVELSPEEEEEQLKQYRAMEKEDREFPDEIELAPEESAKEKLGHYRGIKSLGNCDWDWDEQDSERPSVYSRLLRINHFKATRNKLQKDAAKEAQALTGQKYRLYIRAPPSVAENVDVSVAPFTVYSLLQHEHKLAVTNFSFTSWEDYEKPVPSGEQLIVQYGFRRQVISPMFNQASNTSNNVHKSERFAHQGDLSIATAIAPPIFHNAPAIYFRPTPEGGLELVGQGTFLNCDHTRVMAERTVLTGHPVKIHRRLVTVRFMFFNTEDINWFKAVPLFTKSGRTGFIKESLGTHGYFKSTFDGRLSAQDVVAMALYKRVWPSVSHSWVA
ncbi:hypothetical protein FT663_01512 [Candidozyma haemuli var. vulneris]|uniref:Bms1-type G domain-containing protein n=1 Tax=Candidozyma haemuli TaxID=45357 RepID=A0A2V1ASH8_9ASCO|nr:hypothetical protein CXQ85_000132 [[Candida] haemuloni]KAF3990140.1 hypothetical protein FT662_02464 [[Candida] haemuloni var. vulneris]KAF3994392.1 hypothetical protein FT663_01512 [[Candida] haemuloni var. vulneris]PVH21167.1 hypothetical protein CXQ85_000132 [[Candida] haemuloni]